MLTLPVFYYPSTIVWADDDALFLNAAALLFDENYPMKTFINPKDCLKFFEAYSSPLSDISFLKGCVEHEYYHTVDHSPVDFNVPALSVLESHSSKNQEVSVIILDYNMPEMSGIELFEKLRHIPAKKILLTGEANHHNAISAFNNNIIDRFIRKDSPTIATEIKEYVSSLMQQYFRERTQPLLSHLEADYLLPLSDPKFVTFFQDWCRDNFIIEYSIIDKNGSFVVIDKEGKRSYFIVHTDRSLDAFVDLHDDVSEAKDFLGMVVKREGIPFFGVGKEAWEFVVKKWEKYFFVSKVFNGREKYYWTLIQ